jgi:drug/metabolite transporter (DMT)-like permease
VGHLVSSFKFVSKRISRVYSRRVVVLTLLSMLAFAANSLLCRLALRGAQIDAASFTSIRILSGALVLSLIMSIRGRQIRHVGNWPSALALFVYAAGFSFAYVSLPAATGALILFAAVQATMIGYAIRTGERLTVRQWIGLACALAGLVGLLFPGLLAPPPGGAALMLAAGIAWGIYSLRGKGAKDFTAQTTGNFARAVPFAAALSAIAYRHAALDLTGFAYAAVSGALTSGIGYVLWYAALPELKATHAATVQLSVPVIAAVGAVVFLGEGLTPRLVLASVAILGGIAMVVLDGGRPAAARMNRL